MKKEETQNEENEKKAKIGGDKMQIGDDQKKQDDGQKSLGK
jgi:hypothetical protein